MRVHIKAKGDRKEKIGQKKGKKDAGDFNNTPRAAPPHTVRVVENGFAFLHFIFEPGGTAGKYRSRRGWVRRRDSVCSIVRGLAVMKRVFSNPVVALAAGLGLRLYFGLRLAADSGDSV